MANYTDLGALTIEQINERLEAEPNAHFALRISDEAQEFVGMEYPDAEVELWEPRSPDVQLTAEGQVPMDDAQNPLHLVRFAAPDDTSAPQLDEDLWLTIFGNFNETGRD